MALTALQKEAAKIAHCSEAEYERQLQRLMPPKPSSEDPPPDLGGRPYVIDGSKVHLSPLAREMAKETWPQLTPKQAAEKLARHLLQQSKENNA
jgi:hypothetical protein